MFDVWSPWFGLESKVLALGLGLECQVLGLDLGLGLVYQVLGLGLGLEAQVLCLKTLLTSLQETAKTQVNFKIC